MAEKVTKRKSPTAQARGKKGYKTHVERIKAQLLEEINKETSSVSI